MKCIFDETADRRNTNSEKWRKDAIASISANREAEPFWVADMDFLPEPHIKNKAEELASLGVFGYPSFPNFRTIAASWLKNKHNWIVSEDDILYSMGLLHGVSMCINLLTNKGDRILVPSPTYRPFRELCSLNDRIMEDYELGYEDGTFYLDRERFVESAKRSKMILFCSPHNPSGLVFTSEELEFVLSVAKDLNIPVVSDEIHGDLVHPGYTHIPMGKANENIGAETVTLMAPSKTFNVAGEHSAIVIFSSESTRKRFSHAQKSLWVSEPGYLIGELTEAAYKDGLEWNEGLCKYLGENAEMISSFLSENDLGIKMVNGKASFVTFLDCSGVYDRIKERVEENPDKYSSPSGGVLSRFFGVEASVAMNDGSWFGEQYTKFVRFNYGTSRDKVYNALLRIKKAVESI
ncbi:MAG: MalY/PatB family protein [Candidatus Ornithospirochaeta sp.]